MRALPLVFLLTACGGGTIVQDRPVSVSIPVVIPCVGDRPAAVTPLKNRYPRTEWDGFTVKQKAELASAQGLKHQNYGTAMTAATGECP